MQRDTVFSVSEINEYVKMTLESTDALRNVWLCGEISNFKSNYSSGHLYFSLKDREASIRAVMFRGNASRLKFRPESGMKVLVNGRISVYAPSGDYQIIISDMQPDGVGALALAFEQLKKKLESEGLFDRPKHPIPSMPQKVGVITSASGAALHDIISVSGRRSPGTQIVIYPAYVQGDLAPRSLVGGIRFFNERCKVDVIIIGRGGGSAEDLWCFNDEELARAVAASEIPVISAVGHETDFTICDFAADLRAPTPSAAAELAFPDLSKYRSRAAELSARADRAIIKRTERIEEGLELTRARLALCSPEKILDEKELRLAHACEKLDKSVLDRYADANGRFALLASRLGGADPLRALMRGYAMVNGANGEVKSSVAEIETGEIVSVTLSDGVFCAQVLSREQKNVGG